MERILWLSGSQLSCIHRRMISLQELEYQVKNFLDLLKQREIPVEAWDCLLLEDIIW